MNQNELNGLDYPLRYTPPSKKNSIEIDHIRETNVRLKSAESTKSKTTMNDQTERTSVLPRLQFISKSSLSKENSSEPKNTIKSNKSAELRAKSVSRATSSKPQTISYNRISEKEINQQNSPMHKRMTDEQMMQSVLRLSRQPKRDSIYSIRFKTIHDDIKLSESKLDENSIRLSKRKSNLWQIALILVC